MEKVGKSRKKSLEKVFEKILWKKTRRIKMGTKKTADSNSHEW